MFLLEPWRVLEFREIKKCWSDFSYYIKFLKLFLKLLLMCFKWNESLFVIIKAEYEEDRTSSIHPGCLRTVSLIILGPNTPVSLQCFPPPQTGYRTGDLSAVRPTEPSDHVAQMSLPPLAGKFSKYSLNWMWAEILPLIETLTGSKETAFRYLFHTHELVERTNNRNSYSSSVNTSIRPTTFFVVSLIHRFTFSSVFICSQQCKFIKTFTQQLAAAEVWAFAFKTDSGIEQTGSVWKRRNTTQTI